MSTHADLAPIPTENGANLLLRKFRNSAWQLCSGAFAFCLLLPLAAILGYLAYQGFGALDWNFFTQMPKPAGESGGGVANALVGSCIVIGLAAAAAIPVGLLASIHLHEYARGTSMGAAVRFGCDMLNATPSIVIGIFAYAVIVMTMGNFSAIAGAFALFVMMLPVVVRASEEILKTVPDALREASLALGATPTQTIIRVVLPAARKGLTTAVFLSVARVGGETAPLLFTALGNDYWSTQLNEPISTLPVQIYKFAMSPYEDLHRQAWAAALVLVIVLGLVNAAVRLAGGRSKMA